jgi:glycosyltransferase involved in cell wall biosynthesis
MISLAASAKRHPEGALAIVMVAPPWYEVPPLGYGGVERVCYNLVQHLVARGHHVTLVATGRNRTAAQDFIAVFDEPLTGLGTVEQPVQDVRYAARLAQLLRDVSADVIHDHALATPLTSAGRQVPTILTAHGPTGGPVGDYFRHLGLPLVAISDCQRRRAPDLPWVATVPNSVDVARFPFREKKEELVVFVGRMSAEKGVHLVPEAARRAGFPCAIAAKCGEPDELLYFEHEVQARLGDDTTWCGEIGDAERNDLLARARCVLLPVQWEEPFGLVAIEAMACGTPVVALARGSMTEIVDHGRTGLLCGTPDELPEAIKRASEIDPAECRRQALARFDTSVMAEGYERTYRRVAAIASPRQDGQ